MRQMTQIEADLAGFLRAYKELCQNYNLYVGACGDCRSPWVIRPSSYESVESHIEHLRKESPEMLGIDQQLDPETGNGSK